MYCFIRFLGIAIAVIATMQGAPVRAAPFLPVVDDDLIIVQIRLGRYILSEGAIGYHNTRTTCVSLEDLTRSLDFAIEYDDATAEGWFLSEDRTFSLDWIAGTLAIEGNNVPLNDDDIQDDMGMPCISLEAASRWFPVDFKEDIPNAIIFAESREPLPVEQRQARRSRQSAIGRGQSEAIDINRAWMPKYLTASVPNIDISLSIEGGTKGLSLNGDISGTGDFLKLSTRMLASFDDEKGLLGIRGTLGRQDPRGILPDGPLITQFAIGDITTHASPLSSSSKAGRGIFISSQALDRPEVFDRTTLRGILPRDWEVELYRNKVLLEAQSSRTDGRYEFIDVPVLYGRNEFVLKFYGPQGQARSEKKEVYVGNALLSKGETRFSFGIHEQDLPTFYSPRLVDDPSTGTIRSGIEVVHGLGPSLTVGTRYNSYVHEGSRQHYADIGLNTSLLGFGLFADFSQQISGGQAASLTAQRQLKNTMLILRMDRFDEYLSEQITGTGPLGLKARGEIRLDTALQTRGDKSYPIGIKAAWIERQNGSMEMTGEWRNSIQFSRTNLTHSLKATSRVDEDKNRNLVTTGSTLISHVMKSGSLRASADYSVRPTAELARLQASADIRVSKKIATQFDLGYATKKDQITVGAGVSTRMGALDVGSFVRFTDTGNYSFGLNMGTSFIRSPSKSGWHQTAGNNASAGVVQVRAFVDQDADGIYDEGEPILAGAVPKLDGMRIDDGIKTAQGNLITGLSAYEPHKVTFDMKSVDDPYLVPGASTDAVIIPRPGRIAQVDIPFVRSGEIVGEIMLSRSEKLKGAGDVIIELRRHDGTLVTEARSEFDGFFYFDRVPYGDYYLSVQTAQMERLNLSAAPSPAYSINQQNDVIEGVRLILKSDDTGS